MAEHICDGCGQRVDAEHVRQRIARLERATSFRPIHIATLLLWHAPPPRLEDYFYSTGDGERTAEWKNFFDVTLERCGIPKDGRPPAELLTDFQRQGFFLADCVECPLPADAGAAEQMLRESVATAVKRIQFSCKPKAVIAVGEARKLLSALRESEYVSRLIHE